MPKIIHLDENHELLKNELGKLGFKNYFDLISTKKEVEKKIWEYQGIILRSRIEIDKKFIEDTGLKASLTPSRSNGFLNILLKMQSQANEFL